MTIGWKRPGFDRGEFRGYTEGNRAAGPALFLSTVSALALLMSPAAQAQSVYCPSPDNASSCTISGGNYTATYPFVGKGDDGDDDSNGDDGPDYRLSNYGTITLSDDSRYGLALSSSGGDGDDDGHTDGGDGGNLSVYNYAPLTIAGSSTDDVYGILVQSLGGQGGGDKDDTGAGGDDGGRGGDSGTIYIENNSTISLQQALPNGGAGIYALAHAGKGGDQDSTVGDQHGGNSGDAKDMSIVNNGAITLGSSSAHIDGRDFGWGIAAIAEGNKGGHDNGNGGTGGNISVTNNGTIDIYWNDHNGSDDGVRGIYALSKGGDGRDSEDNSDKGGKGEAGYQVEVYVNNDINVVSDNHVDGLSGAVVAISQGGDGGKAPSSNEGGKGANAGDTTGDIAGVSKVELHNSANVTTQGEAISGVVMRSKGGDGGDGEDGERDSSGGDGGHGGAVSVGIYDTASIITSGTSAYGFLAQSIGGTGGDGGDNAALVGQTGGGGVGGNGGRITFTADSGTQIQTFDDYAAAIALQSIGGGGGTGGDFLTVLGAGGAGGQGGDGGSVTATNTGFIYTSGSLAPGMLVQSIAGSGGAGDLPEASILSLGGDGGLGGNGGNVSVTNNYVIATFGYGSRGIIAQSISGGGGAAGTLGGGKLIVGGSGGGGGAGGLVQVYNRGSVQTTRNASTGILAQSIGGGGGAGAGGFGLISVGGQGGEGGDAGEVQAFLEDSSIYTDGDFSYGLSAQSIGGGGGDGGDVLDFGVLLGVGVGGSGGIGGDGGHISVGNRNLDTGVYTGAPIVSTTGDNASAILAQSVGGGGGTGGNAVSEAVLTVAQLTVGGDAGDGSTGGQVDVAFQNLQASTLGSNSNGIVAQSVGGGGGIGGAAYGANESLVFASTFSLGGKGGQGGDGGRVNVDLTDSIISTGSAGDDEAGSSDSIGIIAQSVGGGGGIGGRAMSAAIAQVIPVEVPASVSFTLSAGGDGGAAGKGGDVDVNLYGNTGVTTGGDGSHGILAQSIGGGGGTGGNSWTYAMTSGLGAGVFSASFGETLGSQGGAGGDGDTVTVRLNDSTSVVTSGNNADGIVAQSIGGGGGNAGRATTGASASFGFVGFTGKKQLGGDGGAGGNGDYVTVDLANGASVATMGDNSHGIVAQSIGGGGGTSQGSAFGLSGKVGITGTPMTLTGSLSMALGLKGGVGGDGSDVTISDYGTITTSGIGSIGIAAQSIGGGGGIGGSVAGNDVAAGSYLSLLYQTYQGNVGIGGAGGTGGVGGAVDVTFGGSIGTQGDHAIGIMAQSIGGGGGLGGAATIPGGRVTGEANLLLGGTGGDGGDGGTVTATFENANAIVTDGVMAHGVLLQSIGGGGGVGGDATDNPFGAMVLGANFGGDGGEGSDGDTVTVNGGTANITTYGNDAMGLVAQSVGGGGGLGAIGSGQDSYRLRDATLQLQVGGTGGSGAHGGDVNIQSGLNITTNGSRAFGVLAQSVGGGGGIGAVGASDVILSLGVGGLGGSGGHGGDVTVISGDGSYIETHGSGAHGLVAQSVGGGGGIAGDATTSTLVLDRKFANVDGNGDGGDVGVDFDGTINVSGVDAFGIVAQSIGGGGGLGGDSSGSFAGSTSQNGDGHGGDVTVVQSGAINAIGSNGIGIFAQSQGAANTDASDLGTISIEVGGTVGGGANQGAGVFVSGGRDNVLVLDDGAMVSAYSGTAVRFVGDRSSADGSRLDIYNYGIVAGDVLLENTNGDGSGAGDEYDLGAQSRMMTSFVAVPYNAGTFNNFGISRGARTLQANVVNQGQLFVGDQDGIGETRVTGNFEQAGNGTLVVDADFENNRIDQLILQKDASLSGTLDVAPISLLPRKLSFLTVDGERTGTLTGKLHDIFTYRVLEEGSSLALSVDANFDGSRLGLTGNRARIAKYFQRVWDAGGEGFGSAFAALAKVGGGGLGNAIDAIHSPMSAVPAAQSASMAQQRLDRLMSCPVFEGPTAMIVQTQCIWAQFGGQRFNQGMIDGVTGYDDTTYSYALGGQFAIADDLFMGLTAAYEASDINGSDGRTSVNGDTFAAGISLKYNPGPWLFAGALSGSYGSFDNSRQSILGTSGGLATSSSDVTTFAARGRVAYTFADDSFYAKPYVDLDLIYANAGGYAETGAGVFNQTVDDSDQWAIMASPSFEIGSRFALSETYQLRGYARAGVTFSSADAWTTKTRFTAAPGGAGTFDVTLPMDDVFGRISLGAELTNLGNGMHLRAEYDGAFSENTSSNSGMVRFSYDF